MIRRRAVRSSLSITLWSWMAAAGVLVATGGRCAGAIVYSAPGSLYTEGFDGLPTDAGENTNLEPFYPEGWRDDSDSMPASHISVPGWYLYHPLEPANENGSNGHQRLRMGTGQNTGGFWAFGNGVLDTEKALGSIGSTTVAGNEQNMFIALRLTNATGITLTEFALTYDGEQWRDGQAPTGEAMAFAYSTTANASDWFAAATPFTAIASLGYTSSVVDGVNTAGANVNGNAEGLISDITGSATDLNWAPGTDLWLRWADPQLQGGADDGLAIDNIRFLAVPEPATASLLVVSGLTLFCRRRHG